MNDLLTTSMLSFNPVKPCPLHTTFMTRISMIVGVTWEYVFTVYCTGTSYIPRIHLDAHGRLMGGGSHYWSLKPCMAIWHVVLTVPAMPFLYCRFADKSALEGRIAKLHTHAAC